MKRIKGIVLAFLILSVQNNFSQSLSASKPSEADKAFAEEEFRRGVQSFYRGAFNDAVMIFEKALSWLPGEPLILDWLGKAYYRTGAEGAALQQWSFASEAGYGSILLKNRIEIVKERRMVRPNFDESTRFIEASLISAKTNTNVLFKQPISVASNPDGTFWMLAYGSNELILFDVNGVIIGRYTGPLGGFDRPVDLYRLKDGRMLVSELAKDRISIISSKGTYISSFGKKGRGNGELLGPQYIATDAFQNIYITDYGNARIVVFDIDGNPLFTFGTKSDTFSGFKSPSGIAIINENLYVADSLTGELHVFDLYGNYAETLLPAKSLVGCEALRVWKGNLLASVVNRVVLIDPVLGITTDLAKLGNAPVRITSSTSDINGNLLVADYTGEAIQILSQMSELVGGMFVQIERVNAEKFPQVIVEVRIEDRNRHPIVGLKAENFLITEDSRSVSNMSLRGAAYQEDSCDITIMLDRSLQSDRYLPQMRLAIQEIAQAMKGKGNLRLVSAGVIPVLEGSGPSNSGSYASFKPKSQASNAWRFDLGLRLAVNDLINASKKRAIIYLSSGDVSSTGFSTYGLNDLASYMNNNGVSFSVIQLKQGSTAPEYQFLSDSTGGNSYYVYRDEGLASVVSNILETPNGSYVLSYTSNMPTNFGKAYLPVGVEVYLMNRSGRDETGYFAPLE